MKAIGVRPKNYREIVLAAIELADQPVVMIDGTTVSDYSRRGPLTQRGIRQAKDLVVREGRKTILGFHDHPDEMFIAESYRGFVNHCEAEGWLKIEF
jgi:hypothetical protein